MCNKLSFVQLNPPFTKNDQRSKSLTNVSFKAENNSLGFNDCYFSGFICLFHLKQYNIKFQNRFVIGLKVVGIKYHKRTPLNHLTNVSLLK